MEYQGGYKTFDATRVWTYPLSTRSNKVTFDDLVNRQPRQWESWLSTVEDLRKLKRQLVVLVDVTTAVSILAQPVEFAGLTIPNRLLAHTVS